MSHFFKHFEQIAAGMQSDDALAKFASSQNFRRQVFGDQDPFARCAFSCPAEPALPKYLQ